MSGKSTKRVRRQLRPIYLRLAREAEARRKIPGWRVALIACGFPGFARRWLSRWEKKNTEALARVMKKTAHALRGQDLGRKMRPGPQPLPGVQPDKPWPRPAAKQITPGELV